MGATRTIAVNKEAFGNGTFLPIPVGSKVKVSVFEIKEGVTGPNSKKPGTPQFEFTAKVTDDFEFTGVDPDTGAVLTQNARGREIRYNYIPLDENAGNAWALVAFAEAVGWEVSKETGVAVPVDLTEVLGTEFIAKIGQNKGQDGKTYNRVTGYQHLSKAPKGGSTPATPAAKSWDEL